MTKLPDGRDLMTVPPREFAAIVEKMGIPNAGLSYSYQHNVEAYTKHTGESKPEAKQPETNAVVEGADAVDVTPEPIEPEPKVDEADDMPSPRIGDTMYSAPQDKAVQE